MKTYQACGMKTYHDSNVKWFWREHAMFADSAKLVTKAINRRMKRRERKLEAGRLRFA